MLAITALFMCDVEQFSQPAHTHKLVKHKEKIVIHFVDNIIAFEISTYSCLYYEAILRSQYGQFSLEMQCGIFVRAVFMVVECVVRTLSTMMTLVLKGTNVTRPIHNFFVHFYNYLVVFVRYFSAISSISICLCVAERFKYVLRNFLSRTKDGAEQTNRLLRILS